MRADHYSPGEEALAYEEILRAYHRQQMVEHLTGPIISFAIHVAAVIACVLLLVGRTPPPTRVTVINFGPPEPIVQLTPDVQDELDKLKDEFPTAPVRTVQPPVPDSSSDPKKVASDLDRIPGAETELLSDLSRYLVPVGQAVPDVPDAIRNRERLPATTGSSDPNDILREVTVQKALEWLKLHQNADGSWSETAKPAMTGLAVLTYLAHNEKPGGSAAYGETVRKGLLHLVKIMSSGGVRGGHPAYQNAIATYALGEGYAMTRLPWLRGPLKAGLERIIGGQQPDTGGWDYAYAKGERWDLSVSGWQIQALKAGKIAGIKVAGIDEALEASIEFVRSRTYADGRFGYASPGQGSPGIQGAGTFSLQMLGLGQADEVKTGVVRISRDFKPKWEPAGNPSFPAYAWYYQAQAVFHAGRRYFNNWYDQLTDELVRNQKPDGHWETPGIEKGGEWDPYYNTCLNALTLQVKFRYLELYKQTEATLVKADVFDVDSMDVQILEQ